jgi:hypothetical protein
MTELFLNGLKVALKQGETIATTIQANDLAKPESVQSSYTNTFQVVATTETRSALGCADEVSSDSNLPYTILDAELISDGRDILPFGLAEIVSHENQFFDVSVYSGNISFFDALGDKLLNELNLDQFDHVWTYENVSANTANTQNFIYDLIDRGKWMDFTAIYWQDLMPSVFGKLLFDRIVSEAGFTYTGFNSEFMNKMLIPAITPIEYPEAFLETITTHAGTSAGLRTKQSEFEERAFFDADSIWGYSDGSANCYDPANMIYVAKYPAIVNVEARLMASIGCSYGGTVNFRIAIYKNGVMLSQDNKDFSPNFSGDQEQPINTYYSTSANSVLLAVGDVLEVMVKFTEKSGLVRNPICHIHYSMNYPSGNIYNQGQDYFKITPLKIFPKGGIIKLANFLPNIKQKDFIKFCLQLHNGVCQSDLFENKIKFAEFRSIETNTAKAFDWSNKFVSEKNINYKFGDFAQINWIKYKDDPTVKTGYANGKILCSNQHLPKEADMIDFAFAASEQSTVYVPLVSVPIYKWNGSGWNFQQIVPRVLMQGTAMVNYILIYAIPSGGIEAGVTYKILNYSKVFYDGKTYYSSETFLGKANVRDYTTEGFGHVYDINYDDQIYAPVTFFDRAGQNVSLNFQNYVIPNFYSSLSGILNQLKYLKAWVRLTANDIASYDATIPVWIEKYQHYFYVNKISEFQAGKLTEVELIRL